MDPWGNAAAQYNQGLAQLSQINQQGFQAQAQGPASIYDRFIQGYAMAKQQRMQEEQARREAEFKQQQLDIQRMRWSQEDQQTKLRETAKVQAAIAQNYRPELRGSIAAELKAINPEWDDKKIESILPPRTPETIQIDGNAPLPLMPNDPVTLKNPAMRDDFLGMNPLREKNDAEQFQIAEQRRAATQAALDADRKADNARAERLAEQRHQEFLASTRYAANAQANMLKAIAERQKGAGVQTGGSDFDPFEPLPNAAEEMKAKLIKDKKLPPQQVTRGNPRADIVNARAQALAELEGKGIDAADYGRRVRAAKDFGAGGKSAEQLKAMDAAIQHFDLLKEASQELARGNVRRVNEIGNYFGFELGKPGVNNHMLIADIANKELQKLATTGVGTGGERDESLKRFTASNSPEQTAQAVAYAQKLMGGKIAAIHQQYKQVYGDDADIGKELNDRTREVLKSHGYDYSAKKPAKTLMDKAKGPNDQSQTKTVVKKEQNAGRKQTRFTYSDGTVEVKDGLL